MTKKETNNNQSMTNYPLPHQDASEEELMYASLDGKHTAMMEDEKRAIDFLYAYTTKLAPNITIAKTFQVAYAKEKIGQSGIWIPPGARQSPQHLRVDLRPPRDAD
jgi:hypothetical protein